MKIQTMVVLFAALLLVATAQATANDKPLKTAASNQPVQASVDKPDRTRKGSLSGTVVDEKGKAVEEAKVELTDIVTKEPPISATTNEKGQYTFSELLPGTYSVQAKKEGVQSDSKQIKISTQPLVGVKILLRAKGT